MKLRAEVKLGELTKAMPKKQGARSDLTSSPGVTKSATKKESLEKANRPKQNRRHINQHDDRGGHHTAPERIYKHEQIRRSKRSKDPVRRVFATG